MRQILPLAKPSNYIKIGDRYILSGKNYLALPGSITENPNIGANKYNDSLINHYLVEREPVKYRIGNTFSKFYRNRRVAKVKDLFSLGEPYYLPAEFSKIESYLFTQYLLRK